MESGDELRPSCEEPFIFISKDWTLGQLGHGTLYLFPPPAFSHPLECYKKIKTKKTVLVPGEWVGLSQFRHCLKLIAYSRLGQAAKIKFLPPTQHYFLQGGGRS